MLEADKAKVVADAVRQVVRTASIETEKTSKQFNALDESRANARIASQTTGSNAK